MQSTRMQMDMELHKPSSWTHYKLGLNILALVLRSGIGITSPDPETDIKLHVSSGVHHEGTIKVIVVS